MRYVLVVFVCGVLCCCSVHRGVDSSLQERKEEIVQLDVESVRNATSVSDRLRLFQGGYSLRGNWRVYDTSAPQLPDGSFPVLAEGCTEEQGNVTEKEEERFQTQETDSMAGVFNSSTVEDIKQKDKVRVDGEAGVNWINALIAGICIGVVVIGFGWWKYGKKD